MFQKFNEYLSNLGSQKETSEDRPKFEYTLNRDAKKQLKQSEERPKIVVLYDLSGGTAYCDRTVVYLENKGFDVVLVTPEEGLDHPVFKGRFNGIYLPGGPNVPVHDPSDRRRKLEHDLTRIAESRDLPLLGICRGEQTVGDYHGCRVTDIPEDEHQHELHYEHIDEVYKETQDPTYNSKVVVGHGSQLYWALQTKLNYRGTEDIEYYVTCLHHQHVEEDQANISFQVTGRGKFDRLVESFEKKTGKYYTVGYQHHPEAVISSCEEIREERVSHVRTKSLRAQLDVNHFSDPDIAYQVELKFDKKLRAALEKTPDERAARAEMGFFSKQVKNHYLDEAPKQEAQATDIDYNAYFCS
ncbi:gamma-glutamyl-gamma-aminobutyrate hydrolase family protein [Legionella sp. WA2022007384]